MYVKIYGERRKLFSNRGRGNVVGIIAKGKRKHGYIFSDWSHIEKIYYPSQEKAVSYTHLDVYKRQAYNIYKFDSELCNLYFFNFCNNQFAEFTVKLIDVIGCIKCAARFENMLLFVRQ